MSLVQALLNLVDVLTNCILFLSEHLKLALSLIVSLVVLCMLVSAHSKLIGDLGLEDAEHCISNLETFVDGL